MGVSSRYPPIFSRTKMPIMNVGMSAKNSQYPHDKPSSGMFTKFIPHIPVKNCDGTIITVMMVKMNSVSFVFWFWYTSTRSRMARHRVMYMSHTCSRFSLCFSTASMYV